MRALVARGLTVVGGGVGGDLYERKIRDLGVRFENLRIDQGGTNPISDLRLLYSFYRWYKAEAPDVVHHFTIKPVIYGSIAAYLAGVPKIINTITGLGYVYSKRGGLLRGVVEGLYRVALRCATHVFFQNEDDRQLFVSARIVPKEKTSVVPGSGVDLERFRDDGVGLRESSSNVVVLIVARLLKEKGIGEFVDAARLLRSRLGDVSFRILGGIDTSNPAAVTQDELDGWLREGAVDWLGHAEDVRPSLRAADIVVLPSYYPEGTPRSLLEAAAMGKVIVTTDTVGCRNVVEHGVTGFLVPPRDASQLAKAIFELATSADLRARMGAAGRRKMETEFDEKIVIEKTLDAYAAGQG
jgi:glycosyltransferase involved in cell wall biosynthesis